MTLQALMSQARYWASRQGRIFWVGVALLLGAIFFYAAAVVPLQHQLVQTRVSLQNRIKAAFEARPSEPSAALRASVWMRSLSSQDQLQEPLALIVGAAEAAGVELQKGEYKLQRDGSSALQRYQLTFPIRSNYPAIRRWLIAVMGGLPSLALQSISMQRQTSVAEQLEARVVFILHVKTQP